MNPSRPQTKPVTIRWRGKPFTIAEACALAVHQHRSNDLEAAVEIYGLVLARVPDYAEGHNNRGVILQLLKRYAQALACYDRAVALKPEYANAHFNRGTVLKKLARLDEALASYDRTLAIQPNHAEAHNNRGVILQDMKRYEEALASYDRVVALNPGHATAWNNRGIVLVSQGTMSEAEKSFQKAAELKADFPDPLFNLANIRQYESTEDEDVKKIRALLDRPGISPETREHLFFTLGKICDDCGRYDEAFEHFRQANQIRNTFVAYDPSLIERMTDGIREVFTETCVAEPYAGASSNRRPLFIVGMPRSGTTLMASILSNHRAIATAGELSTLGDFTVRLRELTGGEEDYPAAARNLNEATVRMIAAGYEKRLCRDAAAEISQVIDKNPLNFRHIGFIMKLFPQARIIHCTREPLATCVSNYFQRFPLHLDYAFDLRNIGHFYAQYARLMEHWRSLPGLALAEVSYEEMILNTEATARRMLEFLGLDWDDRCLTPHTNPAPVETASQWQVRQPIYRHSLDGWRHYEKHLAPLRDVLAAGGVISHGVPE